MKEIKDLKLQDIAKLDALSEADLKKELDTSLKKAFVLKMKKELGELKQTHLIKFLRKYVARIKTIANIKGFNIG
jgi:large subunit ribosomal protein L29